MENSKFRNLLAALWEYLEPGLLQFSYLIRAIWFFLPGLIFVALACVAFVFTEQGRDVLEQSLTIGICAKLPIVLGIAFWSFTSWYTSRILAYNDNDFHEKAGPMLGRFPRLIAYSVIVVIGWSLCNVGNSVPAWCEWSYLIISYLIFELVSRIGLEGKYKKLGKILENGKKVVIYKVMTIAGLIMVWLTWEKTVIWPLLGLFLCQTGAISWVSFRKNLPETENNKTQSNENSTTDEIPIEKKQPGILMQGIKTLVEFIYYFKLNETNEEKSKENTLIKNPEEQEIDEIKKAKENQDFLQTEVNLFKAFNLIAFFAVVLYFGMIVFVDLGRLFGSFTFVLLAFAILLGCANIISLISFRSKVNWHFVNLTIFVVLGFLVEPHNARVIELTKKNNYSQRPDLKTYLDAWFNATERRVFFADPAVTDFPVYFVIADGGASRSGYWTANVLAHLHDSTKLGFPGRSIFSRHLMALAGASGGSVGNVTFLTALMEQHENNQFTCPEICKTYLSSDFLTYPLARLLGPELINVGFWNDRAVALEASMEYPQGRKKTEMKHFLYTIRGDFNQFMPFGKKDGSWVKPIICINTTCMQDGLPGVISSIKDSLFYPRIDVLDQMDCYDGIRISTAMVLGARFPYLSPAGKLGKKYYVDGGYFDNSGAGSILQLMAKIESIKDDLERVKDDTSFFAKSINKLRFNVIHLQNNPLKEKQYKKVPPLLNDLAAPLITLSGSYGAQTNVNDHRLKIFLKKKNYAYQAYHPINLYVKKGDKYPMNWSLSNNAIEQMNKRVEHHDSIRLIINELENAITKK